MHDHKHCVGPSDVGIRYGSLCTIRTGTPIFNQKNFDYPEKPLKYKHIRRISD